MEILDSLISLPLDDYGLQLMKTQNSFCRKVGVRVKVT